MEGDYILYVGNFGPHKNLSALLRTYAHLDKDLREKFSLVLAGRRDEWTPRTRHAAGQLGVGHNVRTPGHVAEQHLPALYAGASAFVTLSRWEGFGLPVLEAMACCTPVMCSNRTSLPEVAGDAALLVDPDDREACEAGLGKILTDELFRAELQAKGLARAKDFSPGRFAKSALHALKTAIETSR